MASMSICTPFGFAAASPASVSPSPSAPRSLLRFRHSASLDNEQYPGFKSWTSSEGKLTESEMRTDGRTCGPSLKLNEHTQHHNALRYGAAIEAKMGNPPIMPAVMTPGGPLDLSSVLFSNRIIFIGQPVNSQVAQRVISQLLTLASIDEDADILVYLNCPGGSTYSVLAIYDCMSWIKPKVGTVCFGVAASQGALLLAGGDKGMRYAMPNAHIMIHQPQSGCGGHVEDVRRQVKEAVQSRHKIDQMYAAFTGQLLEKVQQYTERDRFLSSSEALEFGLIDGVLETEY